jgi:hypothetical protein
MLISLEIKDNKARVFLEFLNSLDFVTINKSELSDEVQNDLLNGRLEEYRNDSQSSIELKEVLDKLKAKYGF